MSDDNTSSLNQQLLEYRKKQAERFKDKDTMSFPPMPQSPEQPIEEMKETQSVKMSEAILSDEPEQRIELFPKTYNFKEDSKNFSKLKEKSTDFMFEETEETLSDSDYNKIKASISTKASQDPSQSNSSLIENYQNDNEMPLLQNQNAAAPATDVNLICCRVPSRLMKLLAILFCIMMIVVVLVLISSLMGS